MCTGAEIAGLALSGIGTAVQMSSADDAAEKQQNIINQAAEATAKKDKQKAALIQNFAADTYNPADRAQGYENAATKQEGSLVDALLKANAGNNGGEVATATSGAVSSDYDRAKGAATAAATEDILKRARLMARNDASGLLYQDEALKGGELSSDVAGINSSINNINRDASVSLNGVKDKGSLVAGLLTGLAPAAGKAGGIFNTGSLSPYGG